MPGNKLPCETGSEAGEPHGTSQWPRPRWMGNGKCDSGKRLGTETGISRPSCHQQIVKEHALRAECRDAMISKLQALLQGTRVR